MSTFARTFVKAPRHFACTVSFRRIAHIRHAGCVHAIMCGDALLPI
ncbi:hypothetical protein BRPE64_BCDS00710 [Caballeronia insecticola]|uniref:Uncharacterized protein n=1 Tax=Caballeronia insecticola TaxID=758793 RepID=R4X144_9BURK|nr:hypothetical protein BRPE64_BCDS00710 [Caballeronia insecticola]